MEGRIKESDRHKRNERNRCIIDEIIGKGEGERRTWHGEIKSCTTVQEMAPKPSIALYPRAARIREHGEARGANRKGRRGSKGELVRRGKYWWYRQTQVGEAVSSI